MTAWQPAVSTKHFILAIASCAASLLTLVVAADEPICESWERVLPPVGIEIPKERLAAWQSRIERFESRFTMPSSNMANWTDVAVLVKACKFAIEFREFYSEKDFAKCDRLLDLAEQRLKELPSSAPSWTRATGLQVRGFQSAIDGSVQPIGLHVPEHLAGKASVPLFVWLHGRGDKATDLHFLCERLDKKGEICPDDAITLHAFGRHCVGYKSAGSTDVMEAIDYVCDQYPIDPKKIVLMGFSMGGAGVWHLAAHYTDRFVAASPGAGFAETALYQNLKPESFPPIYEQMLWRVNDVPGYTRNLFNLPVIAYSGELDKQIQAARVMEEAFRKEGRTLDHRIGPGMGHKYHPEILQKMMEQLSEIANQGQPSDPASYLLQTHYLRFASRRWIAIDGMEQPYADTRIDALRAADGVWNLHTHNVSRLILKPPTMTRLKIDDSAIDLSGSHGSNDTLRLVKNARSGWQRVDRFEELRKHPGVSGPIDDIFYEPFLIVLPSGTCREPAIDRWVRCESQASIERWKALMRGTPRIKFDRDVTEADISSYHLVLWGDSIANSLTQRVLAKPTINLEWSGETLSIGTYRWDARSHVPIAIMPNPLALHRCVVLNSGLTFREAHDKTNSLQNPHLPDWAIVSVAEPRTARQPGQILAAGFFDDRWQFDPALTFTNVTK